MDKKELKSVIATLSPGSAVTLTFLGEYADRTGTYTLESVKVGRGKGGSRIMMLRSESGGAMEAGTSQSDFILNITGPDGVRHGHESASEVPQKFETNKDLAKNLKEQMTAVVGFPGSTVRVTSTEPGYNGDFTVTDGSKLKGRYGQVRLALEDASGTSRELWSYRHSGIVSAFEVLTKAPRTKAAKVEDTDEEETSSFSE